MYCKHFFAVATVVVATTMSTTSETQADLIITIPHVTVAPGASGFLDVLVSSDGTDSFQSYFLNFVVGGTAHSADPVNFVESIVPAPQLNESNYVFFGNSLEGDFPVGIDFVTDPAGIPIANDLITVSDETLDLSDRTINSTDGPFLLARLNFLAPLTATLGSVYDVSLDFGEFGFFDGTDFITTAFISQAEPGSITISAAAVPEPSSLAILAITSLVWLGHRRRASSANS